MKCFAGILLFGVGWLATSATASLAPVEITGPLGFGAYDPRMGSQPVLLDQRNPIVAPQNATCAEFIAQVVNYYAQPYLLYVEYSLSLKSEGGQLTVSSFAGQIFNTSYTSISGCFECTAGSSVSKGQVTIRMTSVYPAGKLTHQPETWNMLFVCDSNRSFVVPRQDATAGAAKKATADDATIPFDIMGPSGLRLYDSRYGVDPTLSDPNRALVLPPNAECATVQFGLVTDYYSSVASDWQYRVAYATSPQNAGSFDLSIPATGCLRTVPSPGSAPGTSVILGSCDYLRSQDFNWGQGGQQASSFASVCFRCAGAPSTVLLNVTLSVDGTESTGDLGVRKVVGVDASFFVKFACGAVEHAKDTVRKVRDGAKQAGTGAISKAKEEVKEGVGAVVKGAEAAKGIWDRIRHRHH